MKIVIGFAHFLIILAALSSPWWLDWRIILAGIILYYLQIYLFRGCLLSQWQFENKHERFWSLGLKMIGIRPDPKWLDVFLDIVLPAAILLTAFFLQNN